MDLQIAIEERCDRGQTYTARNVRFHFVERHENLALRSHFERCRLHTPPHRRRGCLSLVSCQTASVLERKSDGQKQFYVVTRNAARVSATPLNTSENSTLELGLAQRIKAQHHDLHSFSHSPSNFCPALAMKSRNE